MADSNQEETVDVNDVLERFRKVGYGQLIDDRKATRGLILNLMARHGSGKHAELAARMRDGEITAPDAFNDPEYRDLIERGVENIQLINPAELAQDLDDLAEYHAEAGHDMADLPPMDDIDDFVRKHISDVEEAQRQSGLTGIGARPRYRWTLRSPSGRPPTRRCRYRWRLRRRQYGETAHRPRPAAGWPPANDQAHGERPPWPPTNGPAEGEPPAPDNCHEHVWRLPTPRRTARRS